MKMTALYDFIDNLMGDYMFEYKGKSGSICPFSRTNIAVCYDGESVECTSVSEAMDVKIFNGYSAREVCDEFVDL
nr:MAG TPA: hypothetical protein [Caudoviricetes sp.]DAM02723.1 MAG TPA: hypothetical protein [Caudoviricetes sp.]